MWLCVLPLSPADAVFVDPHDRIDASALIKLEWALGTDPVRSQKFTAQLEPEFHVALPFDMQLTTIARIRADVYDRILPRAPSQDALSHLSQRLLFGDRADLELREFYLEGNWDSWLFTIGKQQIVWGQADGLKVLDVVNPQDFREFILADFDESRIPLWAVNLEVPIGDITAQVIWIPDPTYHELPAPGARYAFTTDLLIPPAPPSVPVDIRPVKRPRNLFYDSDVGLRLSYFWHGWDLTFNYLYHYHDTPVLFRRLEGASQTPRIVVTPGYERSHLVGGTFSNAFGDLTVRGELGLSLDRHLPTRNLDDADGVVSSHELGSVLGLDWCGFDETLISGQIFQTWVMETPPGLLADSVDHSLSIFFQREFLNDQFVAEFLAIHNVNRSDGLLRPKLSYELSDSTTIWIGSDIFYGTQTGLFGQFKRNDRVVFGLEWGS